MPRSFFLFGVFLIAILGTVMVQAAGESGELETKVNALIQTPYTGTLEEYPAYITKLGDEILALVDPCFQEADLSPGRKSYLAQTKNLGLLLRYGFDEAEYDKKYEEFLEAVQDYPLYRKWIAKQYYTSENKIEKPDKTERAEALSELLDRWAPLINKYFVDEKRDDSEQLPSVIVTRASSADPDGSLGLVRSTVEKLRPVLEADAKRTNDFLLRVCGQGALNSIRRLDMVGKLLEYAPDDLDQKTVDIKSLKGKTVLIVPGPYQWEEEKLASIKKLYDGLKDHDFEIIIFSPYVEREVARQKYASHGESWIVATRYGGGKDKIDYAEYFGTYSFAFIVNREGIVIGAWAKGVPEVYERLKPLFPKQVELIAEVAGEIRSIDDKIRQKSDEERAKYKGETEEKIPEPLQKLVTFRDAIRHTVPAEINLTLTDLILASDDLPQEKRLAMLKDKVDILGNLADKAMKSDQEMRPEIAYQEMNALADELLKTAQSQPFSHYSLLYSKQNCLYQMSEYLTKMKSGQEEYADEITKRFVEITKMAPENFYANSRMFAMFYQGDLEGIDLEQSTQLTKSFVEQVIPVFATKGVEYQQYAKRLENVLRRVDLIGRELEFECILMNGEKVNVKDLRGKIVVVNIWATWCGPCVREFPNMKKQYDKYKDDGYEMIAYSIDNDLEAVTKFQEKKQYPWLIGSQVKSKEAGLIDYHTFYGCRGVPMTFLLDRDGKVRFMMCGSDDDIFNRKLEELFDEEPAS